MRRVAAFTYGVVSYAVFLGTLLYAVGWLGNFGVPRSIDAPPPTSPDLAWLIDIGLLSLFAAQHSLMARPGFKRVWTKVVPEPVERSTYVLFSSAALIVLFVFWRPLGGIVWDIEGAVGRTVMYSLYTFGWMLVLVATFLIDHFDMFGLKQVYSYLRGAAYTRPRFGTPGPYKVVRHPVYVGWFFAFWATPVMTVAHLLFAVMTAAYILVAIRFEERDLVAEHGSAYREYRRSVPMLIPALNRESGELADSARGAK